MSINNLFYPNNYTLYDKNHHTSNSLTANNITTDYIDCTNLNVNQLSILENVSFPSNINVVQGLIAGTNITIDPFPNPAFPTISTNSVQSVVAGTNISVDNTDPYNPVVSTDSIQSVIAGTNISVDNTDPYNPVVSCNISASETAHIYRTTYTNISGGGYIGCDITAINTYTLMPVTGTTKTQTGASFSFPNDYTIKYIGTPSVLSNVTLNLSAFTYVSIGRYGFFIFKNGSLIQTGNGLTLPTTTSSQVYLSVYTTLNTNDEITVYASSYDSSTRDVGLYLFDLRATTM